MIDKVAAGKVKEANASWWGFNEEDSTEALQAAINSGAGFLEIERVFWISCFFCHNRN